MKDKLAVFIVSFDGYSDVWPAFFSIFDKYWSECPFKIYFVTNFKTYNYKNVINICVGEEISWFDRVRTAINQVEEEYILFMLEDYFIGQKVENTDLYEIIDYIEQKKLKYYRLIDNPYCERKFDTERPYISAIPTDNVYNINLQLSIWKKTFFIDSLNKINGITPWDFEILFKKNMSGDALEYANCCVDKRDIFNIKNGVIQGKWVPDTIKYFDKQGIYIDTSFRQKIGFFSMLFLKLKIYLGHLDIEKKNKIKKLAKKIGFKFMTD